MMVGTGKETLMQYYSVAKENVDGILWSIAMLHSALMLPLPINTPGWRSKRYM